MGSYIPGWHYPTLNFKIGEAILTAPSFDFDFQDEQLENNHLLCLAAANATLATEKEDTICLED